MATGAWNVQKGRRFTAPADVTRPRTVNASMMLIDTAMASVSRQPIIFAAPTAMAAISAIAGSHMAAVTHRR